MTDSGITKQCTGAAKPVVLKWTINCRGPVITDVIPLKGAMQPPNEIDGARVIEWAWSGDGPFGEVPGADDSEIYGLAIATYDDIEFYRFSCDKNWNTVQDALYDSVAAAKDQLPDQYRNVVAEWTGN